jgi:hypothetical protein
MKGWTPIRQEFAVGLSDWSRGDVNAGASMGDRSPDSIRASRMTERRWRRSAVVKSEWERSLVSIPDRQRRRSKEIVTRPLGSYKRCGW